MPIKTEITYMKELMLLGNNMTDTPQNIQIIPPAQ